MPTYRICFDVDAEDVGSAMSALSGLLPHLTGFSCVEAPAAGPPPRPPVSRHMPRKGEPRLRDVVWDLLVNAPEATLTDGQVAAAIAELGYSASSVSSVVSSLATDGLAERLEGHRIRALPKQGVA